jgi:Secretion system C-terminal sorting domain
MKFITNRLWSINKKRYLFLVIFLYSVQCSVAQSNLVLNPGFENHYDTSLIGIASFREGFVTDWSDPNRGSSDYFVPNSYLGSTTPPINFVGFQYPHRGYCYGGFILYDDPSSTAYEYVQSNFASPLQAGKSYGIELYASLSNLSMCVSDLGFYFSDTQLLSHPLGDKISLTPQYENPSSNLIFEHQEWQRILGHYIAHGGERYLSIGMFKPYSMAHTDTCAANGGAFSFSYLYIDDLAVYDTSKTDTIHLCMNDSVKLGGIWRKTEGFYVDIIDSLSVNFYLKFSPYTNSVTIIDRPFIFGDSTRISFLQTTGNDSSFASSIYNFKWIKSDTVIEIPMYNVYGCDSIVRYTCRTIVGIGKQLNGDIEWSIYPNPANDFLQIILKQNDPTNYSVAIIDVTGQEVLSHSLLNDRIDISALKGGMYFIKLINTKTGNVVGTEKFVKE